MQARGEDEARQREDSMLPTSHVAASSYLLHKRIAFIGPQILRCSRSGTTARCSTRQGECCLLEKDCHDRVHPSINAVRDLSAEKGRIYPVLLACPRLDSFCCIPVLKHLSVFLCFTTPPTFAQNEIGRRFCRRPGWRCFRCLPANATGLRLWQPQWQPLDLRIDPNGANWHCIDSCGVPRNYHHCRVIVHYCESLDDDFFLMISTDSPRSARRPPRSPTTARNTLLRRAPPSPSLIALART